MHLDKTNKDLASLKTFISFCLSSPSACLALQHGSFLPREWPIVLVETNTLRSILLDVLVKICKNEQTSYLFVTNKQLNFSTHH